MGDKVVITKDDVTGDCALYLWGDTTTLTVPYMAHGSLIATRANSAGQTVNIPTTISSWGADRAAFIGLEQG